MCVRVCGWVCVCGWCMCDGVCNGVCGEVYAMVCVCRGVYNVCVWMGVYAMVCVRVHVLCMHLGDGCQC